MESFESSLHTRVEDQFDLSTSPILFVPLGSVFVNLTNFWVARFEYHPYYLELNRKSGCDRVCSSPLSGITTLPQAVYQGPNCQRLCLSAAHKNRSKRIAKLFQGKGPRIFH